MVDKRNILSDRRGPACTITINNPEKRNALSPSCLYDLTEQFLRLAADDTIRVVILRGAGREAFSAGADIAAMSTEASGKRGSGIGDVAAATAAIRDYPYPVIAMQYGYALGAGCILAMACDIRIASDKVRMGIPTSRMGLIPTAEGFKRFLIVLGYSTALEIFLTGRQYDGGECLAMGMVNHLVPDDALEAATYRLAKEISRCAPLSLKGAKHILTRLAEDPDPSPETIARFNAMGRQARESDDHEEAKRAFREKREPVFRGK